MFHRSYACLAVATLMLLPVTVSATNYDVTTTQDVIAVDGYCSLREAMLAINERRGLIGHEFTDQLGVDLQHTGGNLEFTKKVINITRSSLLVTAGERLVANRGDVIEYRITVRALVGGGDASDVTISYLFPDQMLTGYRGYASVYQPNTTKLNGDEEQDPAAGVFPLSSPFLINSPTGVADGSPPAQAGLIREGESAQVVFRITVEAGVDEVPLEELPGNLEDEEDREYLIEAECPAGTLSNALFLDAVPLDSEDPAIEYTLLAEIEVGQDPGNSPTVTLQPRKNSPFDDEPKKNVVINAAEATRAFRVFSGATLSLDSITVAGNADNPVVAGANGGLIYASGSVDLSGRTLLTGGQADNGGAIYIEGNRSLTFSLAKFEDNVAAVNGGAIATSPDFSGTISGLQFHFIGNQAAAGDGGAIFFDNQDLLLRPQMFLTNGTMYGNQALDGAAVRVNAIRRLMAFNNLTIAGNDGGAAVSFAVPGDSSSEEVLLNTAVLGNAGGDCAADDGLGGPTLTAATIQYVVSMNESCGPQDEQFASDDPLEVIDYSLADFSLLMGVDPATPAALEKYQCGDNGFSGSAGCLPREFDDGFKGFLPNNRDRAFSAPAVFGFGSPEDAVGPSVCESKDQRGKDRASRCDVGSVELQVALGTLDELTVVQGVRSVADVIANDLGDLDIDCRRLDPSFDPDNWDPLDPPYDTSGCFTLVLTPQRGAVDVVIGDNAGTLLDANGDVVPPGYPMVHYVGPASFHGVDQFRYVLDKDAINGATFAGENPSASVIMVVQPESGLTKKEDITTLSGAGNGLFLGLFMMIFRIPRRAARLKSLLLAAGFLIAPTAYSADILVNTLVDEEETNGLCSLREALRASFDNTPFFVPDCTPGATGRDRIIIDVAGTITLNGQLEVEGSSVDIEGLGFDQTTIDAAGLSRVILASSNLTLKGLTLQGGNVADNGGAIFTTASLTLDGVVIKDNTASGSGGAIYLNYSSDLRRAVDILRTEFSGNAAGIHGGVLSMIGQSQEHEIFIDSSAFLSNSAGSTGGALDINLPRGGNLRVINSTFNLNSAAQGAAIDLQQIDTSVTAYILNSTFINSAQGGAAGAIETDNAAGAVHLSHSIYSGSGQCSTSGTALFRESYYNLFSGVGLEPSCLADTPAGSVGNDFADQADIELVLNGGALVAAEVLDERFIPSHYPIQLAESGNPAYLQIVDAGNESLELAQAGSSPRACRAADTRGRTRESGVTCDLGAFELQVPTAIDDSGTNQRRFELRSRVPVLENDLVGDGVPGVSGIVDSTLLSGSIDLNPASAGTVDATLTIDHGGRPTTLTRVPNGSWEFTLPGSTLPEGEYEVSVILKDLGGVNLYNARQTIIVRSPAVPDDDDDPVSSGDAGLKITSMDVDSVADDDFITTGGVITLHGTSIAEDESEIEIFLDGESVGTTTLSAPDADCGVLDGTAIGDLTSTSLSGRTDDCIVLFDPGELTCADLEGGYEESFSYRFFVYNEETGVTDSTEAEVDVRVVNVPPRFVRQREDRAVPGEPVVFAIDATDPDVTDIDGVAMPINLTADSIVLQQPPQFAASSERTFIEDGNVVTRFLTFGIVGVGAVEPDLGDVDPLDTDVSGLGVVVDPGARTVTYTPRRFESRFNDRFVLKVTDTCGAEMSAEFRVIYPGGTDVGSLGGGMVFVSLLLLLRRGRRNSSVKGDA
jgi:CSLREA domain-containing protein